MRTAVALSVLFLFWTALPLALSTAEEPADCSPSSKWEKTARSIQSTQRLISFLQKMAVDCPGNLLIVDTLGKLLLKQNRPEAAVNALRSGLLRTPGLTGTLLRAAETQIAVKNYQQALRLYRVARVIDPAHPRIRALFRDLDGFLPLSSLKKEQDEPMLKVFFEGRKARERLSKSPDDKLARRSLATFLLAQARVLVEVGETEEAEKLIRQSIQQDPKYRAAREAMVERILEGGDYHFRGEDYSGALQRYRKALQWLPDSIAAHIRIAQALQEIPERRQDSLPVYLRARVLLKSQPDRGSEKNRAEWSLAVEEGITYVDTRNPLFRKRAARRELAQAEQSTKQGRLKEAIEAFHRALNWTPKDAGIHYSLADTLRYVETEWRDAILHYSQAIRLSREIPPPGSNPEKIKFLIRHAERERARLEKSHTGTLAYIRAKFFLAMEKRRTETILFIIVFGSVLVFLWRSKTNNAKE